MPTPEDQPARPHILLVAAAPAEAGAVAGAFNIPGPEEDWRVAACAPGWWLVRSGVGKVNAAVCVARSINAASDIVLNVGVCGALPIPGAPTVGSAVVANAAVYADEGVVTPGAFVDMARQGFGYWPGAGAASGTEGGCRCSAIACDAGLQSWVRGALSEAGLRAAPGAIACVSSCSGTNALAGEIAHRTGAIAEAMEGAAIGHTLLRLRPSARFLELRVVSNTTGDRGEQVWDLKGALAVLTCAVRALHGAAGSIPRAPAGGTPSGRAG